MLDGTRADSWVLPTLLSALLFAAGNALQKQGVQQRLPPLAAAAFLAGLPRLFAALLRNPAWLLGLVLTLVALGVEIRALALGDVSAVKPLSRVQSLFALAIGVGLLRERLRREEWIGVIVIAAGAAWLASEPGDSLVRAPSTATCVAVALGTGGLVAALLLVADRSGRRARSELTPALAAGALFGLGDVLMKATTETVRAQTGDFDPASAATFGVLAESAELLLSLAATGAAFAIQQLAFARGRLSLVVPLVGMGGTLVAVGLGAILLDEPVGASRLAGVATMLAGGWLAAGAEQRSAASVHSGEGVA